MPTTLKPPRPRHQAHRRQRPFRRQSATPIADRDAELRGQILAEQDAGRARPGAALSASRLPATHRLAQIW